MTDTVLCLIAGACLGTFLFIALPDQPWWGFILALILLATGITLIAWSAK